MSKNFTTKSFFLRILSVITLVLVCSYTAEAQKKSSPAKKVSLISPRNGSITAPLQEYSWPQSEKSSAKTPKDRGLPRPVSFAWKKAATNDADIRYDLIISRQADLKKPRIFSNITQTTADVWNLRIGTRYFWKVVKKSNGLPIGESPVWSFVTNNTPPRWIKVPGITNVRDIGGWPIPDGHAVRQGMIYRSSEMNQHLNITEEGKRVILEDLGIRTDLDLRGMRGKGIAKPVDGFKPDKIQWINIPIVAYHGILLGEITKTKGDTTVITIKDCKENYRRIFQLFANESNYPILIHCWGGADRAGTVVFLLNALLGVEKSNLFQDYELTSLSIFADRSCSSEGFQKFLRTLAKFGKDKDDFQKQAENYLLSIGVTPEEIQAIRSLLIVNLNKCEGSELIPADNKRK